MTAAELAARYPDYHIRQVGGTWVATRRDAKGGVEVFAATVMADSLQELAGRLADEAEWAEHALGHWAV